MKPFSVSLSAAALVLGVGAVPAIRQALADDTSDGGNQQPQVILSPQGVGGAKVQTTGAEKAKRYEGNAEAIEAGKALYAAFNCNGCHAGGGGGFGPALSDDHWIYGGSLPNIVDTLYEGRPRGMPAWRGKIPDEQMWQLAAYVKSLSHPGGIAPPL